MGIDEEDIETVLSPFGQVDNSYQRNANGIGLGLPFTKKLAEMHGGTLSISSVPGQGTTVEIMLPIERIVSTGPQAEQATHMNIGQV